MRFPSRCWRFWLLAALPLAGAVALGCTLALGPSSGVTEANFRKLQVGMTPEQVDEILGAENRRTMPDSRSASAWSDFYREEYGDVDIIVLFGGDRLVNKRLERVPQTLADLLRGRLAKVRRRIGL